MTFVVSNVLTIVKHFGYVYMGTLERFYLEPFRVGTLVSWNHYVQKVNIAVENIMVENFPF